MIFCNTVMAQIGPPNMLVNFQLCKNSTLTFSLSVHPYSCISLYGTLSTWAMSTSRKCSFLSKENLETFLEIFEFFKIPVSHFQPFFLQFHQSVPSGKRSVVTPCNTYNQSRFGVIIASSVKNYHLNQNCVTASENTHHVWRSYGKIRQKTLYVGDNL